MAACGVGYLLHGEDQGNLIGFSGATWFPACCYYGMVAIRQYESSRGNSRLRSGLGRVLKDLSGNKSGQ